MRGGGDGSVLIHLPGAAVCVLNWILMFHAGPNAVSERWDRDNSCVIWLQEPNFSDDAAHSGVLVSIIFMFVLFFMSVSVFECTSRKYFSFYPHALHACSDENIRIHILDGKLDIHCLVKRTRRTVFLVLGCHIRV